MTAQTKTAKVTTVKLGNLEIEGLLIDDGSFGVALQQVASLFSVLPNSVQKWLKARLDNGFQFFQVKTDRPKQDGKQLSRSSRHDRGANKQKRITSRKQKKMSRSRINLAGITS